MAIGAKLKSLVGVALLSGAGGFVVAGTVEGGASAPEATAAEAALSLRDVPVLEEAFIDTAPADRDDGIEVGELGVDGGDRNSIVELAREIAAGEHGAIDSLLIAHHGKLVFESYYLRGRVNLPHPQASATKAYTSLAIGRAIQLGHLTAADLERPLIGFFEDLDRTRLVEGAESITLHKAMTMSSGLRIGEERMEELEKDAGRLEGWGEVQAYLEQSAPVTGESQSFNYQGTDPRLVMQVLDAVVPGSARDFIEKELLDELGIAGHDWEEDASGLPAAGAGSSMTSRGASSGTRAGGATYSSFPKSSSPGRPTGFSTSPTTRSSAAASWSPTAATATTGGRPTWTSGVRPTSALPPRVAAASSSS